MDNYFVSVLIPVYGVEQYIERCCRSLFEQTYESIEYIFVNDCTRDRSVDILYSLLEEYPERVPYVKIINHLTNKGLGAARNTAVENATGLFVIHVDSDDYIDRDMIRRMVEEQMRDNADIVSANRCVRLFSDHSEATDLRSYSSPKNLNIAIIKHEISNNIWGRLIRRSLYIDNAIRVEPGINMSEDINVLPRLLYFAAMISDVPCTYYYECGNNYSYTSSFSEEKARQSIWTLDYLAHFFKNKGEEYTDAINTRRSETLVKLMKNCVKIKGHKPYYQYIRHLINATCDKKYLQRINVFDRLLLYISQYELVRLYVRLGVFLKRIY